VGAYFMFFPGNNQIYTDRPPRRDRLLNPKFNDAFYLELESGQFDDAKMAYLS